MANSWSGYPNGRIPTSKMKLFRNTGKYMQPDAANWLGTLLDAAARAGHTFTVLASEDLYRDLARQQYFWANQKQLGIVAAYPGTSNHGWALAADVDGTQNAAAWAWLVKNAPSYHYKLLTVPSERWHWVYTGPTTTTAGGGDTPIPPATTKRKNDMATLYHDQSTLVNGVAKDGTTVYALAGDSPGTPANWLETKTYALAVAWAGAHGNSALLSKDTFAAWKKLYLSPVTTA